MKDLKICVIGLGHVGLPLAQLFSTKYETIGFDMNQTRVDNLMQGHDATEVSDELLQDTIDTHDVIKAASSKWIDIHSTLLEYTPNITIFDPWANAAQVKHEYGIEIVNELPAGEKFDACILAVAHNEFLQLDVCSLVNDGGVVYDVKGVLPRDNVDKRL